MCEGRVISITISTSGKVRALAYRHNYQVINLSSHFVIFVDLRVSLLGKSDALAQGRQTGGVGWVATPPPLNFGWGG